MQLKNTISFCVFIAGYLVGFRQQKNLLNAVLRNRIAQFRFFVLFITVYFLYGGGWFNALLH